MKNLLFFLIILVGYTSCSSDAGVEEEGKLPSVSKSFALKDSVSVINFIRTGEAQKIVIETDMLAGEWSAWLKDKAQSWLTVDVNGEQNSVTLIAAVNSEAKTRSAVVLLGAVEGDKQMSITVNQLGMDPAILVDKTRVCKIGKTGGKFEVKVTTNVDYLAKVIYEDGTDWIQESKTKAMNSFNHVYSIRDNSGGEAKTRFAKIVYSSENISTEVTTAVDLYQISFDPNEGAEIPKDILYLPVGGRVANKEFHEGYGIERSFDGNKGTIYRSRWDVEGGTKFPVTLEYDMPVAAGRIDYLMYHAADGKGPFGVFELFYNTTADETFKLLGSFNAKMTAGASMFVFEKPVEDVKTFKFVVANGSGNAANCAEMEFYSYNMAGGLYADLLKVFKNLACVELVDGVKRVDIEKLPGLFQDIAFGLQTDSYEKEFRVGTYAAHSDPVYWAGKLKTDYLGRCDNPTGIWAEAGEKLQVLVGPTHGNDISLFCMDASVNANGKYYKLKEGINEITTESTGLFYVQYYLTDLQANNAKPIDIHIPVGSGRVNGYFDLERDRMDAKYQSLLAKATFKMFDVRGKRTIFCMHTISYPSSQIVDALKCYDQMCEWNWEIMGVADLYPAVFNLRHLFITSDDVKSPNATNYRTQYPKTHYPDRLTLSKMKYSRKYMWGPAHEVGHQLQDVFNFHGFTESSNNFFSNLFVWKSDWGFKSRGAGVIGLIETGFDKKLPFIKLETFLRARIYWQMYIYYDVCGKNKKFWPDFFKLLREYPTHSDPQKQAMNIYKLACDAAKEDLTEFFELWGFFNLIDEDIECYSTKRHTLTTVMVDEARQAVKAKKYPKAAPIQYIEDRDEMDQDDGSTERTRGETGYYKIYKDNLKVSSAISCTRNSGSFQVENGANVVAYEWIDEGVVTFVALKHQFTIPNERLTATGMLYAVQADGQRILVPVS